MVPRKHSMQRGSAYLRARLRRAIFVAWTMRAFAPKREGYRGDCVIVTVDREYTAKERRKKKLYEGQWATY